MAAGRVRLDVLPGLRDDRSPRRGWLPARVDHGWWQPAVNLLGCILFGISAVAGYVVPLSGSVLALAAADWSTSLGAACFLACAVATLFGKQPIAADTADAQPMGDKATSGIEPV